MDTARLTPSHLVVGGSALARGDDGRVVFVTGALPGETVDVTLRSTKKDFAMADVATVVDASPDRVDPPCEAWSRGCGGCDWQHIEPSAQLRFKTEIVREALQRTARLDSPTVVAAGSVAPWSYRTTVRLAGRADGSVGFRSRRSHEIVPIENCPVADERINTVLAARRIDGRQARRDDVMVRVGSDGDHVAISGAGINRGGTATRDRVFNIVAGHRFQVSPDSFFQSSAASAELLVEAVARACADIAIEHATVVDAYGGVGLFGATVARCAAHLVLVESSASSCADAAINLAGQPSTIVRSRMEDWSAVPADLVIADPARNGLDKGGSASVAATGAQIIVLVSCDVGSLARDVRLLQGYGYAHAGTQVLDVFPNTSHIEAVTRFDRVVGVASP